MTRETYTSKFPELGFYGLPGHTRSPRDVIGQVIDAEALGIGNVMISERPDYKEISAICGAVAAVTEEIFIGTSGTNLNTRHPVTTASMGSTLSRLSNGRFALGLAKGVAVRWKMFGLPFPTFAREAEFVSLMRRLWKGETIDEFDGALGKFQNLSLAPYVDEDIPLLYVGFGPKGVENSGRIYDGVHLHTFMGPKALRDSVALVRQGEESAGRAPGSTKVWSVLATTCNVPDEIYLRHIVARLSTYLQFPGYGDMLARINGWDTDQLERLRRDEVVRSIGGPIDSLATPKQLEHVETLLPAEWRHAAVGDAESCARTWVEEFESGADGIIIHASTPEEFAPVVEAYAKIRPAHLFEGRTNRPG